MAMSVGGGGDDEPMMDINTTPLIDVMLVLLIMFIITLPVMTHAVKLDMPQAKNTPPPPVVVEPIQLEIDWDGTIIWNGTPVQLSALEGYFRVEAAKNPQPEVHVRPNRRVKRGLTELERLLRLIDRFLAPSRERERSASELVQLRTFREVLELCFERDDSSVAKSACTRRVAH